MQIFLLQTMDQGTPRSEHSTFQEHLRLVKRRGSSLAVQALPLVTTVSSSLDRPQRVSTAYPPTPHPHPHPPSCIDHWWVFCLSWTPLALLGFKTGGCLRTCIAPPAFKSFFFFLRRHMMASVSRQNSINWEASGVTAEIHVNRWQYLGDVLYEVGLFFVLSVCAPGQFVLRSGFRDKW